MTNTVTMVIEAKVLWRKIDIPNGNPHYEKINSANFGHTAVLEYLGRMMSVLVRLHTVDLLLQK